MLRQTFSTENIQRISPGCLWVQYECFYYMGDKQTALLLTEPTVKEKWLTLQTRRHHGREKRAVWQMFKDTAQHCEGWHNLHQMMTGVNKRSELQDLWTHPCILSSGKEDGSYVGAQKCLIMQCNVHMPSHPKASEKEEKIAHFQAALSTILLGFIPAWRCGHTVAGHCQRRGRWWLQWQEEGWFSSCCMYKWAATELEECQSEAWWTHTGT